MHKQTYAAISAQYTCPSTGKQAYAGINAVIIVSHEFIILVQSRDAQADVCCWYTVHMSKQAYAGINAEISARLEALSA